MNSKKELKAQVKSMREIMEKKDIVSPYISLNLASVEEMQDWIIKATSKIEDGRVDVDVDVDVDKEPKEEVLIGEPKTLSELGDKIVSLSGTKGFEGWEFKKWTKNGTLRIYATDISYRNPKDRGYYVIAEDGTYIENSQLNRPLPTLPFLPSTINDLVALPMDVHSRIVRALNRKFGEGKWTQFDYDDEAEGREYQE